LLNLENHDLVIPRQSIASGRSPVAARESVIRYQMACKEDDYTYSKTFRFVVLLLLYFIIHPKSFSI